MGAPKAVQGAERATGTDLNAPNRQAVGWLTANASRDSRLLVDDTLWVDLMERGFGGRARGVGQGDVVWFYKLDLDPAVRSPWSSFDYVVLSNFMRGNLADLRTTSEVVQHSVPVANFEQGSERVEIRRVVRGAAAVDGGRGRG